MTENLYLSGNFAPVAGEHTAQELRVTGRIPEALEGRLLRIGPNPIAPDPANYHWFLGNGMVHGVRAARRARRVVPQPLRARRRGGRGERVAARVRARSARTRSEAASRTPT